jgi:hypothetical protein
MAAKTPLRAFAIFGKQPSKIRGNGFSQGPIPEP